MAISVEPVASSARREQLVAVITGMMEKAVADQRRSRRLARLGWTTAAAAGLIVVLGASISYWRHGEAPPLTHVNLLSGTIRGTIDGHPIDETKDRELDFPPRATLRTGPNSAVRAQLKSGVVVTAGAEAELVFPDTTSHTAEVLTLNAGAIAVNVPKLSPGRTFAVRTPDSVITVHGTTFHVEFGADQPGAAPVTRVTVSEGIVTARHGLDERLLSVGMEWTSVAREIAVASSATVSGPSAPSAPLEESSDVRSGDAKPTGQPVAGDGRRQTERFRGSADLGEQNRLFQSALLARERANYALAVRLFEDFLARYPSSPLAEDAYVQRFRALSRMDSSKTARAARRYLASYPQGFATAEALQLVSEGGVDRSVSR